MIGKIERVPLREIWKHEAYDFTTWLQDNIDILNDTLGIELSNPEREQAAGSFSVDILAEDENGDAVVVENQLEKSDHDHLGKLITYLVAFEAKTAIWIVAEPRPEHINAIRWLNESYAADLYLVKLEGIRINDSLPAPLLTLIVGPSDEQKVVGERKKELAERHHDRKMFWSELLDLAKTRTKLHSNVSPNHDNWISTGAGKSGLSYSYVIKQNETYVELYINKNGNTEENKSIYDMLYMNKNEIEEVFGEELECPRITPFIEIAFHFLTSFHVK